jgi:hypothetical protein
MYTAGTTGFVELAGSATDEAGNTTFTTRRLRVIDPTDQSAPTVIITSPEYGAAVTYLTDIMGSVYDPEGEFGQYVVSYVSVAEYNAYGVNAPNMKEIYHSNSEVHDDVLATFDPTMLRNDDYVVVVGAYDLSGNGWAEPLVISVLGEAKLGNFRLDFVDLSIPLVGIPITVTRTYDTLDAHYQGDFGYGWSLSVQDVDIRETVPDTGSGIFLATPFRVGTRVYLTTPDGRRAVLPLSPSLIERVSLV